MPQPRRDTNVRVSVFDYQDSRRKHLFVKPGSTIHRLRVAYPGAVIEVNKPSK